MRLSGNLAVFLLLVCPALGVSARNAQAGGKREKAERSSATVTRGKFTWKVNSKCTWTATGKKLYTLKVSCQPGEEAEPRPSFECTYTGEPGLCPAYSVNPKAYWRQITRALQKQKRLCGPHDLVRARMCKRSPPGAHFKLFTGSTWTTASADGVTPIQATPTTPECVQRARADYRKAAEEKCGESWQSLCTFLFTFVFSPDC